MTGEITNQEVLQAVLELGTQQKNMSDELKCLSEQQQEMCHKS